MKQALREENRFSAIAQGRDAAVLEGHTRPAYHLTKRLADVLAASFLLILALPILLVTAAAVRIESPGPILFRQQRVGTRRTGFRSTRWELTVFTFYKFRSMVHDSDQTVHERHVAAVMSGELRDRRGIKLSNDNRVTRVGRLLRKTSIDELPQLFNVLRGEMSIVGPRPVPLYEVARYEPDYRRRFTALPGISGLWQVRGRCELSFKEMIACDLEYTANPTLLKDLKIIVQTITAVLSCRGAG